MILFLVEDVVFVEVAGEVSFEPSFFLQETITNTSERKNSWQAVN
jgi:hypothetical protein